MAAARILEKMHTQAECDGIELEWGLQDRTAGSVIKRVTQMAHIALTENPTVFTANGRQSLAKAMIEKAITANDFILENNSEDWLKIKTGLRFSGYEIEEQRTETEGSWGQKSYTSEFSLRPMMPEGVPAVNVSEAENEMISLLEKNNFPTALEHLRQAINNFSNGQWASANGDLRSFFEELLNAIAVKLGCDETKKSADKRSFLGTLNPPFLYAHYNEWDANVQKPQYIQGLWARMHPHGSHPGLSEEDDCTFRLQITLISARLFIRRFDRRVNETL
ncbi:hypothetical protein [Hellea balneolensis]|uniref:hypothetical protein n=1 Tax=Hellea balneolensis TaxID=287478 RepID=UPI0012B7E24D|nr:hypothetical protein [Hellea balneolensis]